MYLNYWVKSANGDWVETAYWSAGYPSQISDVVANMVGFNLTHSTGNDIIQSMTATQAFLLTGGSLTVQGSTANSFGAYSQSNSTFQFRATTIVNGNASLGPAAVQMGATTDTSTIAYRGATQVSAVSISACNFENDGVMTYAGGNSPNGIQLGFVGGTYRATAIYNTTNATFDIQDDSSIRVASEYVGFGRGGQWVYYGVIYNSGLFKKSGGSGTTSINGAITNAASGTIQLQSGVLSFSNTVNTAGLLDVQAGVLSCTGVFNATGNVQVAAGARLQLAGAPILYYEAYLNDSINGGHWTGTGALEVGGSVYLTIGGVFDCSLALSNSALIDIVGQATFTGSIANQATIKVNGTARFVGVLSGTGKVQINFGGTLDIAGATSAHNIFFNDRFATLKLESVPTFAGVLYGAALWGTTATRLYAGDRIDLTQVVADAAVLDANRQLHLTSHGTAVATLQFDANFDLSRHFGVRSDGAGGTLVVQEEASGFHFNGDGFADLLLRDTATGSVSYWALNQSGFASSTSLGLVGQSISIVDTGDMNRDGSSDLLLQDSVSGSVSIWFVQNGQYAGTTTLGALGPQTAIAGLGDLNGDGYADVLMRNLSTGAVTGWLINNGQLSAMREIGGLPSSYTIAGLGDFNGDGVSDILLFDRSSGAVSDWTLTNGYFGASKQLGGFGSSVEIAGVGDFNGDGCSDILLRDRYSGSVSYWAIDANGFAGSTQVGGIGAETLIIGARDVNGDGFADVLLRESSTGAISAFLVADGHYQGYAQLGGVGASYQLIG